MALTGFYQPFKLSFISLLVFLSCFVGLFRPGEVPDGNAAGVFGGGAPAGGVVDDFD